MMGLRSPRACRLGSAWIALSLAACTAASTEAPLPSAGLEPKPLRAASSAAGDPRRAEKNAASAEAPNPSAPLASADRDRPLSAFHQALAALERGERKKHVRVLWLGDSHAQADFWPGYLRRVLQQRFGDAGPGFVHLGFRDYRHNGIRNQVEGDWRMRPLKPSGVERHADGIYGLGGILHAGYAKRRLARIELTDARLVERELSWELCYRYGLPQDHFVASLGSTSKTATFFKNGEGAALVPSGAAEDAGPSGGPSGAAGLQRMVLKARGVSTLEVHIKAGRTDFCGVIIETDPAVNPGVVVDNLGINGARYATALSWDEDGWIAEARRREPSLFVFEYGGNEASDGVIQPDLYQKQAEELIGRGRRAQSDASCLVIGPSDRADAESKIPPIIGALRAAAKSQGCMFWDTYQAMGGRGSLRRWRDGDRASEDGVHLKPKGYAELGALLVADVMAGYRR
jgi:lysophospholipase L1-like esterase